MKKPAPPPSTRETNTPSRWHFLKPTPAGWGRLLLGLVMALLIFTHLDPGGSFPAAGEGPGLTQDESFNVQQGIYLVEALSSYGLGILDPASIREIFEAPGFLPDHPPLGRFVLGLSHKLIRPLVPPAHPQPLFSTAAARFGSGLMFLALIAVCSIVSARWYGTAAGIACMVILFTMPRLRAHGSIAALETCMNLTWMLTVFGVARWVSKDGENDNELPTRNRIIWSGIFFGLALLTKIQAVLLPVPIAVWAISVWKVRAWKLLLIFGSVGFIVFFLGWPWLWLDPLNHLHEYFSRAGNRVSLNVWYLGRQWADHATPWHYPWVTFIATLPIIWLIAGLIGIFSRTQPAWNSPRERLLLFCLLFPLLLFSIPGIAVYDGIRLFLIVVPLWAIFAARGISRVIAWMEEQSTSLSQCSGLIAVGILATAQIGWIFATQPMSLSYYSELVGGLRGAEALGLERTYWGDSLRRSFLVEVCETIPQDSTIAIAPVLHQFYLPELLDQSPLLKQHGIQLVPWQSTRNSSDESSPQFLLVFFRQADFPSDLKVQLSRKTPISEYREQGVLLSALYQWESQ